MTLAEFKAWFEGFTEGIESDPTAEQFTKIKAKVEKIDGAVTTYPVFIDRYVPNRWLNYPHYPYYSYGIGQSVTSQNLGLQLVQNYGSLSASASEPNNYVDDTPRLTPETWDVVTAFRDIGRREAQN